MVHKKQKIDSLAVWELYEGFLDSISDENPQGDVDFLMELVNFFPEEDPPISSQQSIDTTWWNNEKNRLAVLCSAAHCIIAEYYMAVAMNDGSQDDTVSMIRHLCASTQAFDRNANAWSLAANHGRTVGISTRDWYEKAASMVDEVRQGAFQLLEAPETPFKDWIELLLLNHVIGVEALDNEDDDENVKDEDKSVDDSSDCDMNEEWSTSAVEATVRFMAAMGYSTVGHHEKALAHLKYFDLTHRVHPNVWDHKVTNRVDDEVVAYDNVLPEHLYAQMCQVFAPDADYWAESNYEGRGYYSFFINSHEASNMSNLVEAVIHDHLLPLAKKHTQANIVGYEWWVHHRATTQSLGHNVHFDTDEALLEQEKTISHPVYSSVLYLTGGDKGGATIIMDQIPESTENATHAWLSSPKDNRFVLFPGNRLHGVLPCKGAAELPTCSLDDLPVSGSTSDVYRLTFMVGFWARDVPKQMKHRRLYGPCGPMPDLTESWVKQMNAYVRQKERESSTPKTPTQSSVPMVTPVWEAMEGSAGDDGTVSRLVLPKALDHRFFVKNTPNCFLESLFEKDEWDGCSDEDEDGD